MASSMFFNGRQYITPATVSQVDDSAMSPRNAATGNNMAIIGTSLAGEPNVPIRIQDPREAERILMGGELLTAAKKAFAPSAQTGGPRTLTLVRVGQATPAALVLKDSAQADSISLASTVFGIPANGIRVKVEAGSITGKKVTTQLGQRYYTRDNLARSVLKVRYSGSETTATVGVTPTQVVLTAGASPVTLALADFPTVQALADRINSTPGWSAVPTIGAEQHKTVAALDGVTAGNAKNADVAVTADLQAIIDWFNSVGEGFVKATRATGATKPPANIGFTYMAGATSPAVNAEDWANAIAVLQSVDVQWFVPLSGNAAVHAMADAHAVFMSVQGAKERRCFVGPDAGVELEEVLSLPAQIGSDRTGLVWPGHYDLAADGSKQMQPAYMSAVLVAAGFAGVNPGTALTNKTLRITGLEYEPRNPVDTDRLVEAGVCAIEASERGYRVVRSISTWQADDKFNRVEVSCGAATDFVVRTVRERLDVMRGEKGTPKALARAVGIAESALLGLAVPEPAGPGIIVGDAKSPAYTKPIASLEGDIINVSFQCSPVVPLNFVQLGVAIVPYAGTTAAS